MQHFLANAVFCPGVCTDTAVMQCNASSYKVSSYARDRLSFTKSCGLSGACLTARSITRALLHKLERQLKVCRVGA